MLKMIALLSRKPGMSLEDFRDYYENRHVPLINSIATGTREYRRSYIDFSTVFTGGLAGAPSAPWTPDFDVITELWYDSADAMAKARAELMRPENAQRIAADEENFLDRNSKRMFMVDEFGAIV